MATRLCKCGAFKTVQPYLSAMTYPWMCNHCANKTADARVSRLVNFKVEAGVSQRCEMRGELVMHVRRIVTRF